jgi:hypothetical protein
MKILVLLFILSPFASLSQKLSMKLKDSTNIYYHAFKQVIPKNCEEEIYLEYDYYLNSYFKDLNFGDCTVKLLSNQDIIDKTRRNKTITVYKMYSLSLESDYFIIGFIPFRASSKRKNIHYVNGGGCHARYYYDCDRNELIFKEVKCFGV